MACILYRTAFFHLRNTAPVGGYIPIPCAVPRLPFVAQPPRGEPVPPLERPRYPEPATELPMAIVPEPPDYLLCLGLLPPLPPEALSCEDRLGEILALALALLRLPPDRLPDAPAPVGID